MQENPRSAAKCKILYFCLIKRFVCNCANEDSCGSVFKAGMSPLNFRTTQVSGTFCLVPRLQAMNTRRPNVNRKKFQVSEILRTDQLGKSSPETVASWTSHVGTILKNWLMNMCAQACKPNTQSVHNILVSTKVFLSKVCGSDWVDLGCQYGDIGELLYYGPCTMRC